jgi:hypothetical protein
MASEEQKRQHLPAVIRGDEILPADPTKPVGKFYTKFGRHLYSVGYKVDDLVGLGNPAPPRPAGRESGRLLRRPVLLHHGHAG